jgi:hypothetical protein
LKRPRPNRRLLRVASSDELSTLSSPPPHDLVLVGECRNAFDDALAQELELQLARLRLVALAGDAARLAATLAALQDPYDGRPLRQRAGDDGQLEIWSVGPDGIDQSTTKAAGSDDVVLELPRRE